MRTRRMAREYALQLLFQFDLNKDAEGLMDQFWKDKDLPTQMMDFSNMLVKGTITHLAEIDRLIIINADNWSLDRMAIVDRNIIRIAIYELLFIGDIPAKVTLNEAIEISKRYGAEESSAFVNGILDRVIKSDEKLLKKEGVVRGTVGSTVGD